METFSQWLNGRFVEQYFSKSFFGHPNSDSGEDNKNKIYSEDLSNIRIGPARLRQVRVRAGEHVRIVQSQER